MHLEEKKIFYFIFLLISKLQFFSENSTLKFRSNSAFKRKRDFIWNLINNFFLSESYSETAVFLGKFNFEFS